MIIRTIETPFAEMQINADFEVSYTTSSGNSTIIPMSHTWTHIAVQVSGGLDSTMLLYLTAKTIKDYNLTTKIIPVSIEVPNKAKNLESSRNVIKQISALLDFNQWGNILEYIMPVESAEPPLKDIFFRKIMADLLRSNIAQFEFNGNTKNPPGAIRRHFKNDLYRQLTRDDRQTIYNWSDSASPHAFMDKKDIVELYIKFGVLDSLAPLTLSCDENIDIIELENMSVPCTTCWWCCERAWGFMANAHSAEKSYEYTK